MSGEGLPEAEFNELLGKISAAAPLLSGLLPEKGQNASGKNRDALLCALKPYLSEERREAADYLLRAGKLIDLLQGLRKI